MRKTEHNGGLESGELQTPVCLNVGHRNMMDGLGNQFTEICEHPRCPADKHPGILNILR